MRVTNTQKKSVCATTCAGVHKRSTGGGAQAAHRYCVHTQSCAPSPAQPPRDCSGSVGDAAKRGAAQQGAAQQSAALPFLPQPSRPHPSCRTHPSTSCARAGSAQQAGHNNSGAWAYVDGVGGDELRDRERSCLLLRLLLRDTARERDGHHDDDDVDGVSVLYVQQEAEETEAEQRAEHRHSRHRTRRAAEVRARHQVRQERRVARVAARPTQARRRASAQRTARAAHRDSRGACHVRAEHVRAPITAASARTNAPKVHSTRGVGAWSRSAEVPTRSAHARRVQRAPRAHGRASSAGSAPRPRISAPARAQGARA
jgi:hypothetical protein